MKVREIEKSDYSSVMSLAEGLSDWFTEGALTEMIPLDLKVHKGFLAEDDGVVGFVILDSCEGRAKIGWIGVHSSRHGEGVGRLLVERAVEEIEEIGLKSLWVETVSKEDAKGSKYKGTVEFYESLGFELQEIEEGGFDDGETDKAIYKLNLK